MTPASIGNVLLLISAGFSTLGPMLYAILPHTRHTWYKDQVGLHLMAYMSVFAVVIDLAVISVVTGATRQDDWFAWIRTVVFVLVPIVLAWRDWIVVRTYLQKEENNEGSD